MRGWRDFALTPHRETEFLPLYAFRRLAHYRPPLFPSSSSVLNLGTSRNTTSLRRCAEENAAHFSLREIEDDPAVDRAGDQLPNRLVSKRLIVCPFALRPMPNAPFRWTASTSPVSSGCTVPGLGNGLRTSDPPCRC